MFISVSICIPVFNRKSQIMNAVRSALDQVIEDLEVIVVDNHSDDGTWEILQAIDDPRVRVLRNDHNIGMFGNFNKAGEAARGQFVVFLCSDDRLRPGFLAHARDQLLRQPSAALLSSAARLENNAGETVRIINQVIAPELYEGKSVRKAFFWYSGTYGINIFSYPSGIMVRKSALDSAWPFRIDIGDPADVDMWIRCLEHGDFSVTHFVGCDVTWNDKQVSSNSRKSGKHIIENRKFSDLHLQRSDDLGALRRYRRLLGASSLAWAYHEAMIGEVGKALSAPRFGWGWPIMIWASFERLAYSLLAKIGVVFHVGLHKIGGNRADT